METEVWKYVIGYEGLYQVSNIGRVRNKELKEMSIWVGGNGYKTVGLSKLGKCDSILIHRLIAIHFIPNPDNKPQVNHINGKRSDNKIENLEWVTCSENMYHKYNLLGYRISDKMKSSVREAQSIKVIQYDIFGKKIKIWNSGIEASRELGIAQPNISKCCNGKRKLAGGYKWENYN